MGNAVLNRDAFDSISELDVKLGILYETDMEILRILKGKKLDLKSFGGGVLGGFIAVITKMAIWR